MYYPAYRHEKWYNMSWSPTLKVNLPRLAFLDAPTDLYAAPNVFCVIQGSPRLETLTLSELTHIPPAFGIRTYLNLKDLRITGGFSMPALFELLERCCHKVDCLNLSKVDDSPPILCRKLISVKEVKIGGLEGVESPGFAFAKNLLDQTTNLTTLTLSCRRTLPKQEVVRMLDVLLSHSRPKGCRVYIHAGGVRFEA